MSVGLACAAALLYLATRQAALFNDGVYLEEKLRTGQLAHVHLLDLPLMALVQSAVSLIVPITAETAIKTTAALAGGVGVGLAHRIACRLLGPGHAVAAAAVLALLPGYWFHSTAAEIHSIHAACAMVLFAGLLRGLDPDAALPGTVGLVFAGALLSPGSHGSGVGAGLAALFVVARGGRRRIPIAVAGLLGVAAWLALQTLVAHLDTRVEFGGAVGAVLFPFEHPGRIPELATSSLSELFLFAVPAATLLPAGLRHLARSQRPVAWLCVLWIAGYVIVTFSVFDRAMGSYFLPVFHVHAILAAAACRSLGRSQARWAAVLLLALAPFAPVGFAFGDAVTLPVFAICAAALLGPCRPSADTRVAAWPLAIAAGLLTAIAYLPQFGADPLRDRIRAIAAFTGKDHLLLVFAPDPVLNYHWAWHFPGTGHHADFVVNPYLLDAVDATLAERLRGDWIGRIRAACTRGEPVWLVDLPEHPPYPGRATRFRRELAATFQLDAPAGAPPGVHRVREH